MNRSEIDKIKRFLSDKRKIVIIPHKNPDGDAIGSSTALKYYLDNFNHNVDIISPNQFPEFLKWMDPCNVIKIFDEDEKCVQKIIDAELIFTLDFNNLVRIAGMKEYVEKSKAKIIMIDHHEEPSNYADFMYSEPNMSSTCEMIYHFIDKMGDLDKVDKNISRSLYAGIMTDTGSFQYKGVNSTTHDIISSLLTYGIDNNKIYNNVYNSNEISKLKLLSVALKNLELIIDKKTALMHICQNDLIKNNYKKGD